MHIDPGILLFFGENICWATELAVKSWFVRPTLICVMYNLLFLLKSSAKATSEGGPGLEAGVAPGPMAAADVALEARAPLQ